MIHTFFTFLPLRGIFCRWNNIPMLEALDVDEFVAGGKISMFEAIGVDEITAGGNYLAVIKKGIR